MLSLSILPRFCRKEAIRTPDPYVPNVVRYQLRYFPFPSAKVILFQEEKKYLELFYSLFNVFLTTYTQNIPQNSHPQKLRLSYKGVPFPHIIHFVVYVHLPKTPEFQKRAFRLITISVP